MFSQNQNQNQNNQQQTNNNITYTQIEQIIEKYNLKFDNQYDSINEDILNIFNGNLLNIDKQNPLILNTLGLYYFHVKNNGNKAKKYYLKAVDLNCIEAIYNLAMYYEYNKQYGHMKKYYSLLVDLKYVDAINSFAYYYANVEKKYEKSKKMFLKAVEYGDSNAMLHLAYYYEDIEENFDETKKWLLLATEHGNEMAFVKLQYDLTKMDLYDTINNSNNKNEMMINELISLRKDKYVKKCLKERTKINLNQTLYANNLYNNDLHNNNLYDKNLLAYNEQLDNCIKKYETLNIADTISDI